MKTIKILFLINIVIFAGCTPNYYEFEYETIITDTPANLEKLNSEYDDYNSDLPYSAGRQHIYFSSNRNNNGNNFDIVSKNIDISYHKEDDIMNIAYTSDDYSSFQNKLLPIINSDNDEFGPYSYNGSQGWDYFFYSNNEESDFKIKFVYTPRLDWGTYNAQERLYGPYSLNLINSVYDDLYPTINQDRTKLYFCSNRENNLFNIYKADLNTEDYLYEYLINTNSIEIAKDTILSSNFNDKCPSITNNLLVFTSNREGGYGGFDLYYSLFIDNQWTIPINFGNKINSEYDEYRPITFSFWDYYDLMIFSSNRPKGKGGYDLYCVKIGDLIE